jgi:ribonuclease/clavin/mitogillin
VLIDSGVGHPRHLEDLRQSLVARGASLRTVLVTHGHPDHASGAPAIAAAFPAAVFRKYAWGQAEARPGVEWDALHDGDAVRFGGTTLTVIHTPGHSPDHLAFWDEAARALFTGDLVIAGGSVVIDASRGGSLAEYLRSLHRVLELRPRRLFPAHGSRIDDPAAVVRSHLDHRMLRERQVMAALVAGRRTVEAIAESIYDGLDSRLLAAARENVRAHLAKLAADGAAVENDGWRLR